MFGNFTKNEEGKLILLCSKINSDIKEMSEELNRTEKSIRMKLWFFDLIGKESVIWLNELLRKDCPNET